MLHEFGEEKTGITNHGLLAGSSLPSRLAIATDWCSQTLPAKLYERSKPSGPSALISQLSFPRDPTIDTRQPRSTPITSPGHKIGKPQRASLSSNRHKR
jgi:hypothetical protein